MIIVSQDKKEIINFNNIKEIIVNETEITVLDDVYKEYGEIIGTYKTEERAKEVLEEIVNVSTDVEYMHITKSSLNNLDEIAEPKYILKPVNRRKIYYMPED